MQRINKYIKTTTVTQVRITYGDEKFLYNLITELKISRSDYQKELITQPQAYGFLSMLREKLVAEVEQCKLEKEKVWSERVVFYLTSEKSKYFKKMDKKCPQDVAKAYADSDPQYIDAATKWINRKRDLGSIDASVKAFDQRASMLQTLSANKRSER